MGRVRRRGMPAGSMGVAANVLSTLVIQTLTVLCAMTLPNDRSQVYG